MEGVYNGYSISMRLVRGAMRAGSMRGLARGDWDVCRVRDGDVWVPASEWVCDRTTISGKFVAGASRYAGGYSNKPPRDFFVIRA